ncbi:MAG: hypothetical protein EOO40_00270 [Deltaproteobacteria bacterium]|nr:MAG: hypothetical protein EOO40_00270 [Deltaproteobacteria bacterium]
MSWHHRVLYSAIFTSFIFYCLLVFTGCFDNSGAYGMPKSIHCSQVAALGVCSQDSFDCWSELRDGQWLYVREPEGPRLGRCLCYTEDTVHPIYNRGDGECPI